MEGRRRFLRVMGGTSAVLALAELEGLGKLPSVSAAEAKLDPNVVRFGDDIEPLVRLLEETPRERVVEVFANKIRSGTTYREVLAALLLAGVRNVEPRPSVGFKFHAVLVVNSAHLASLASSDQDRWLPIFWALDYFKSAQAQDDRERGWTMAPVNEAEVPPAHRARAAFREAMERWDVEAADTAVTGLVRSAGAHDCFEMLAHYGCRDYRSIGHKAIFVANGFRTLQCIGWRYAEPVLRSLTYALLNHSGEPNPAASDLRPDAAWRVTQALVGQLDTKWNSGRRDAAVSREVLQMLREATPEDAVRQTVEWLGSDIHPQSIIDGIFLASGEMLMQQPGIVALHSSTSTNALQYAYRTAKEDRTRQRLLLQNAAFIPYFRESMKARGALRDVRMESLVGESTIAGATAEKSDSPATSTDGQGLAEIFATISRDRPAATRAMLDYLQAGGDAEDMIRGARRLVFLKGNDSHDYKFSSAVLEDYYAISPEFRDPYLAASAHLLPGSGDANNGLVDRIRETLG